MPIYEYECTKCGKRTEVVQKVSDPPLKKCKACGGALKKILSAPAIQFKGNGWYVTDYARKPSPESPDKSKEKTKTGEPTSPKATSDKKATSSSAKD